MGDLLGSLIWGAKSGQYCVIGGGSLQFLIGSSSNTKTYKTVKDCQGVSIRFKFFNMISEFDTNTTQKYRVRV
jgi:hypothetical protein